MRPRYVTKSGGVPSELQTGSVRPTCNQSVSLVAAELERQGIATVALQLLREIAEAVRPPRALFVPFSHGYPLDRPDDPPRQRAVLEAALRLFGGCGSPAAGAAGFQGAMRKVRRGTLPASLRDFGGVCAKPGPRSSSLRPFGPEVPTTPRVCRCPADHSLPVEGLPIRRWLDLKVGEACGTANRPEDILPTASAGYAWVNGSL